MALSSRFSPIIRLALAWSSLALAACGSATVTPTTIALAAALPSATPTIAPTETASLPPTNTMTLTAIPSSTPTTTDTPPPTFTPTVTRTPRPRFTATPEPTATNTPNPRPVAPLFAETPIQPFSPEAFIASLNKTRGYFADWLKYFGGTVVRDGKLGNCNTYWWTLSQWKSMPGFDNVPDAWYNLYYEYRSLLQQAETVTVPIAQVCASGSGTISDETDQVIIQFFDYAVTSPDRLTQMIAEAQSLK